jgi:hypothetical protein
MNAERCYSRILFLPLYSYLSTEKGVNVLWALGCKAGTEQSELTQVNPDFEEELYRQDYF